MTAPPWQPLQLVAPLQCAAAMQACIAHAPRDAKHVRQRSTHQILIDQVFVGFLAAAELLGRIAGGV
ncbi:hypothetical protein, partial [Xanthomonas nasturtii]|uniref:hypothetical protein n=1 Tax=Xanthomonas nasturtii TaxID=1843581 RepID=UPI002012C823